MIDAIVKIPSRKLGKTRKSEEESNLAGKFQATFANVMKVMVKIPWEYSFENKKKTR